MKSLDQELSAANLGCTVWDVSRSTSQLKFTRCLKKQFKTACLNSYMRVNKNWFDSARFYLSRWKSFLAKSFNQSKVNLQKTEKLSLKSGFLFWRTGVEQMLLMLESLWPFFSFFWCCVSGRIWFCAGFSLKVKESWVFKIGLLLSVPVQLTNPSTFLPSAGRQGLIECA